MDNRVSLFKFFYFVSFILSIACYIFYFNQLSVRVRDIDSRSCKFFYVLYHILIWSQILQIIFILYVYYDKIFFTNNLAISKSLGFVLFILYLSGIFFSFVGFVLRRYACFDGFNSIIFTHVYFNLAVFGCSILIVAYYFFTKKIESTTQQPQLNLSHQV